MMFSGFFGGIFALFCTGVIAIGGIVGIYRSYRLSQEKRKLRETISDFICSHQLDQCEPGFYNGAEKEAAAQLGISANEAYRLISIELSKRK